MIIYRQKAYSDYYLSYDRPSGHFRRNQDKYLIGGGSIAGATIGYISSKKSAEKKAKDKGLQEGTEEYKKAVKKHRLTRTAIGAGIGTITGAGALVGKQLYDVNHHSKKKVKLKERYTDDKYNWLDNNCEHFARELSTGKRSSTQADGLTGRIAKIFRPK